MNIPLRPIGPVGCVDVGQFSLMAWLQWETTWLAALSLSLMPLTFSSSSRHLRRCNLCSTQAVGDELHYVFDCPHFSDIRGQYPALFQDAEGCMRLFVWHRDQKTVSHCLTAILNRAQNVNTDSSS